MTTLNTKDLKPGDVIRLPGFIYATPYGFITHAGHAMPDWIVIGEHEIVFTIPEGFNAVAAAVAMVDNAMEKERAEHTQKMQQLAEKKAELLQITYEGAQVLDAEMIFEDKTK
jgi:hypothetical protein